MAKASTSIKYPQSASLFQFCKEALRIKFDQQVKVIDQDVGAILKYDPTDCSQWKRGGKNITNLEHIRDIAKHFDIDEGVLLGILEGTMSCEEALFEYAGYGPYHLSIAQRDELKKVYFEKPYRWEGYDDDCGFDEIFKIRRGEVLGVVDQVLAKIDLSESIIDLKEISDLFSSIKIKYNARIRSLVKTSSDGVKQNLRRVITHSKSLKCPHIRFLVARELFRFLKDSEHEMLGGLVEIPPETVEIHGNIFAIYLLIPEELLAKEILTLGHNSDVISQLARAFGVSKNLMNNRLWVLKNQELKEK